MLFSAVAFIQNKKFFGTAPKDVQERVLTHEERFPEMHTLGYFLCFTAIAMIAGSVVVAAWDGIKSGYGFLQFFIRFLIMLEGYKIWDMLFLDYYLLTKSNFYQHYYPEIGDCKSLKEFGFNFRTQLLKLLVIFPIISSGFAGLCVLFASRLS